MRRASNEIARLVEEALANLRLPADKIDNQLLGSQVAPPSGGNRGTVALSDVTPPAVANTGSAGTAGDASRSDHRHRSGLSLREVDASPTVTGVVSIIVPNGTLTDNGSGEVTLTLAASSLSISATDRLIGRDTAGAGIGEELTVSNGLEFTGSGGIQTAMTRIGSATYRTLLNFANFVGTAGHITGGTINDLGSGNISVNAGTGIIRESASQIATLDFFDWTALGSTAIPSNTTRYVGVEYNAGSPQVVVRTTDNWNYYSDFPIGQVANQAGTLHIEQNGCEFADQLGRLLRRFRGTRPYERDEREGGLIIGETGTRNITLSAGTLWDRSNSFTIAALNTSVSGNFDAYYRDGAGGFTGDLARTQWPNTQYDDNSGTLATLTANHYGVLWFYLELDSQLVMVYGRGNYTSQANAAAEAIPATVPIRLTFAKLIGRIIFQKSASVATEIDTVFGTIFTTNGVTDHNSLSGLQGGTASEYYHLTAAQSTALAFSGLTTGQPFRATSATAAAFGALDLANTNAVTGTLGAAHGGTDNASYAVGDLLYASGATALSKLADVATGNALISGGVTTAPAWGKIGLTTHISGVLGATNGGTGVDNSTRTLTISSNGGTLTFSAASSTLTIPESLTAAGRDVTNTFTANQTIQVQDAGAANALGVLTLSHNTTGTPAGNFGVSIILQAETTTTENSTIGQWGARWKDPTHASRQGQLIFFVQDSAALRQGIIVEANGSASLIGFLGAAAVVRQNITGVTTGTLAQLQAAVRNLLTGLANLGLITDSTT